MKFTLKLFLLSFVSLSSFFAQGTAGTSAKFEYRKLIDMPTAGVLERGYTGLSLDVMPYGTVISTIEVGVFDNFSFGISFGGSNIIGTGKVEWYDRPGVNARFRVIDETASTPAIVVGFDSQGKGRYFSDLRRYEIKSPGFFAAAAKNFDFLGYLSIHGVMNYSLENNDSDKTVNFRLGVEKTIGKKVSLVAEYDFGWNDNSDKNIGTGRGYLNMGLRWSIVDGFTLGADLRDLLNNKKFTTSSADRAIFVEYVKAIF